MSDLAQFLEALTVYLTVDRAMFVYFIYNAAVQALPDPLPEGSRFYLFVFRFAHALAANINVVRKQVPAKRGAL